MAQSFETLSKVSYLFPQGSSSGIYFDVGDVRLSDKNEVIVGKLSQNTYLFPQGTSSGIYFLAHTQILFNKSGEVISGTPAQSSYLFPTGSSQGIYFSGCPVTFSEKGEVEEGAITQNTYLFPNGSSTGLYFKGGCRVKFNSHGEVLEGALSQNTYLFPDGTSTGQTYTAGSYVRFTSRGEVSDVYPGTCKCAKDLLVPEQLADMTQINDILNGKVTNYDKTVITVLNRNKWTQSAAAIDVTASMDPYVAQVYLWLKLNAGTMRTKYYTFFNDGDNKPDYLKVIGHTGGIYGTNSTAISTLLRIVAIAKSNGNGGDIPENDIEAILFASSRCADCTNIIHVADNNATPRDLGLLVDVTKPVHVIVCGVTSFVNPALIDVAYKTGGTLHTIEQDIVNLSSMRIGEHITIGEADYRLSSDGFEHVN